MSEINFNQITKIKEKIAEIEKELSKILIESSQNKTQKEEIEKAKREKERLIKLKEEIISKPLSIHLAKKIIPYFSKKLFSKEIQNYFYPNKLKRKIRKTYENNSPILSILIYTLIGILALLFKMPLTNALAIFLILLGSVSIINSDLRLPKIILKKHFNKEDDKVLRYLKKKNIKSKAIRIIDSKIENKEEIINQAGTIELPTEDYIMALQIEKASLNQEYNQMINDIIQSKEEKGKQKVLRRK